MCFEPHGMYIVIQNVTIYSLPSGRTLTVRDTRIYAVPCRTRLTQIRNRKCQTPITQAS